MNGVERLYNLMHDYRFIELTRQKELRWILGMVTEIYERDDYTDNELDFIEWVEKRVNNIDPRTEKMFINGEEALVFMSIKAGR